MKKLIALLLCVCLLLSLYECAGRRQEYGCLKPGR